MSSEKIQEICSAAAGYANHGLQFKDPAIGKLVFLINGLATVVADLERRLAEVEKR